MSLRTYELDSPLQAWIIHGLSLLEMRGARDAALADAEMIKREVRKIGIECTNMKYGDKTLI